MKAILVTLVNSMAARILAVLTATGLAIATGSFSLRLLLHVFALAFWFGMSIYTTFIVGLVLYHNLPKRTFGTKQYDAVSAAAAAADELLTHLFFRSGAVEAFPSLL